MASTLVNSGDVKDSGEIKTRRVTALLESLRFIFDRNTHAGQPILILDDTFEIAWKICIPKYGKPSMESSISTWSKSVILGRGLVRW